MSSQIDRTFSNICTVCMCLMVVAFFINAANGQCAIEGKVQNPTASTSNAPKLPKHSATTSAAAMMGKLEVKNSPTRKYRGNLSDLKDQLHPRTYWMLHRAQQFYGKAFVITDELRSVEENKHVGGAKFSSHLMGWGVDLRIRGEDIQAMHQALKKAKFNRFGFYSDHLHVDNAHWLKPNQEWGKRPW